MTLTNLVALVALARWVTGALRDFEAQRRAGVRVPVFRAIGNPHLPGDVPGDVWDQEWTDDHDGAAPSGAAGSTAGAARPDDPAVVKES